MTKKKATEPTWISTEEATKILQQVNGRAIKPGYLYILWKQGKVDRKPIDGRTYLYSKEDLEKIHIIAKPGSGRRRVMTESAP